MNDYFKAFVNQEIEKPSNSFENFLPLMIGQAIITQYDTNKTTELIFSKSSEIHYDSKEYVTFNFSKEQSFADEDPKFPNPKNGSCTLSNYFRIIEQIKKSINIAELNVPLPKNPKKRLEYIGYNKAILQELKQVHVKLIISALGISPKGNERVKKIVHRDHNQVKATIKQNSISMSAMVSE